MQDKELEYKKFAFWCVDNEIQAIPNEDDVYWVELDDIYNLVEEMAGDTE